MIQSIVDIDRDNHQTPNITRRNNSDEREEKEEGKEKQEEEQSTSMKNENGITIIDSILSAFILRTLRLFVRSPSIAPRSPSLSFFLSSSSLPLSPLLA